MAELQTETWSFWTENKVVLAVHLMLFWKFLKRDVWIVLGQEDWVLKV